MSRHLVLALIAVALLCATPPATGQKFLPKTIQFKGDTEYSDEELLKAAGLKSGEVLSSAEMNDHSKLLMDSGVFQGMSFKFDGQDLIFQLTPVDGGELFPIRLENLPISAGPDLDARLHQQFPLYHGKVPAEGGLTDEVRRALEDTMASQGVKATVVATPGTAQGSRKISFVSFSISAPPVQVGIAGIEGVSPNFQNEISAVAVAAAKTPFDTENSGSNLERALEEYYRDRGYAAVKVRAARSGTPIVSPSSILVPFSLTVQEGHIYKIGTIHLPDGAPLTQEEISKILNPKIAGPIEGVRLRTIWTTLSWRYKSKGNLDCKITPSPHFDDATGTANYDVSIEPGPVYHLGFVKFDNVSDEMRSLLIKNWQMLPGDVFDEGYVSDFIAKVQDHDPVLKRSLTGVLVSYNAMADPQTHDVNVVIRLEKR